MMANTCCGQVLTIYVTPKDNAAENNEAAPVVQENSEQQTSENKTPNKDGYPYKKVVENN